METDFFNFQLGSISSPYYSQGGVEDSETSILETFQNDFSYGSSAFESSSSIWDTEGDLSSDIPTLNMGSLDGSFSRIDTGYKEDFHKLLTDWNEHLGSFQVSDEEIDVKEMVKITEKLPDDIFDDSLERRIFSSNSNVQGRKRSKRVIKSDVKLERSSEGRTDLDGDSQIEYGGMIENMMSLGEPEVKIPSFSDDGLLFVPEQPDFLFGECDDDESVAKLNTAEINTVSGRASPSGSNIEIEEDCVDVETVSGPVPVLQAGDLTSLLEQFEASEAVNGGTPSVKNVSVLPSALNVTKNQLISMPLSQVSPLSNTNVKANKGSGGGSMPNTSLVSNQKIRDSLPLEIIEKIKACGRKKPIAVIPAMPSKRNGQRGTRMQDAGATLSRNKLLKIVSAGQIGGGESVQLDHDYCSSEVAPPPPSFYHSDASEYTAEGQSSRSRRSRKEHNSSAAPSPVSHRNVSAKTATSSFATGSQPPQLSFLGDKRITDAIKSSTDRSKKLDIGYCYEKNSKKDSGLESGEVSDAGEEAGSCSSSASSKRSPEINEDTDSISGTVSLLVSQDQKQKPKRKLNLQEYRSRREELEKQRVLPTIVPLSEIPVPKEEMPDTQTSTNETIGKEVVTKSIEKDEVTEIAEVLPEKPENQSDNSEKPKMHSVEVQTRSGEDGEESGVGKDSPEDRRRAARSRDIKRRSYRSSHHHKRNGSSSSVSSTLSHSSYGSASSSSSSRFSSTSSVHRDRRRRRHHRDYHSCHCRSSRPHKPCCRSSRMRSEGKGGIRHIRMSSPVQRSHSQVNSPLSLTSRGSSPSSSLRSATPPSSLSPSPRRGEGRQGRRSRRRSRKESEGSRRSRRSHSCSPSWSSDCSSCYSRSRSPIHGSQHRNKFNGGNCGSGPMVLPPSSDWQPGIEREKIRQVEERRVIYVGRLTEGTTKADLRHRFEVFGPIIDISVHFREHGDNYGFVTFAYKVDAYEAVEHGNDDPSLPKYDLCFGGRRAFCKVRYSDLDAMNSWNSSGGYGGSGSSRGGGGGGGGGGDDSSFDALLREAQAKLRKRKV